MKPGVGRREEAGDVGVLEQAGGAPKTAIVMALAGVDTAAAQTLLGRAEGRVRDAIGKSLTP